MFLVSCAYILFIFLLIFFSLELSLFSFAVKPFISRRFQNIFEFEKIFLFLSCTLLTACLVCPDFIQIFHFGVFVADNPVDPGSGVPIFGFGWVKENPPAAAGSLLDRSLFLRFWECFGVFWSCEENYSVFWIICLTRSNWSFSRSRFTDPVASKPVASSVKSPL